LEEVFEGLVVVVEDAFQAAVGAFGEVAAVVGVALVWAEDFEVVVGLHELSGEVEGSLVAVDFRWPEV
jgi:hypothetical protein